MRSTDLFERITWQIADAIEAGAGDFRMPWARWGEALASPINAVSGKPYRGINVLMLWAAAEASGYSSGRWATHRQWASRGAQVRKGEKSTPVLYWQSNPARPAEEELEARGPRFLAKVYNAFSADQVDGYTAPSDVAIDPQDRVANAEDFFERINADVRHGGDRACYVPAHDQICLPKFQQFRDAHSYYATLAHETVHWSGAKHRLDRNLSGRFGTDDYAMEELVAELGSAFIAAHLGLSVEPRPDHAAYVSSWLRVLRSDPRAILTAAAKAQEAIDYIVRCTELDVSFGPATKEEELEQAAA
ncbi:zincin-like metallopeptidase domain-containing protein [Sphingomonas sp. LHG3406-1]|uniref:ArdC family protein n=1 Tax=Sphingomonas sp. LHG3406-1 TaxID=2804617 RepID=UPI0026351A3E|nr:zincin-like metallopeptidase domain-containing protein [Sphingomonas sp. LHG3406-1]